MIRKYMWCDLSTNNRSVTTTNNKTRNNNKQYLFAAAFDFPYRTLTEFKNKNDAPPGLVNP